MYLWGSPFVSSTVAPWRTSSAPLRLSLPNIRANVSDVGILVARLILFSICTDVVIPSCLMVALVRPSRTNYVNSLLATEYPSRSRVFFAYSIKRGICYHMRTIGYPKDIPSAMCLHGCIKHGLLLPFLAWPMVTICSSTSV